MNENDKLQETVITLNPAASEGTVLEGEVVSINPEGGRSQGRARRGTAIKLFAAFVAGTLTIGGFTYTADRNNWFTGVSADTAGMIASMNGSEQVQPVSYSLSATPTVAEIVAAANPAVVRIGTKVQAQSVSPYWQNDGYSSRSRGQGGRWQQGWSQGETAGELQDSGTGTGFLFDQSGYILTNEHVINGADVIEVSVQGYDEPFIAKLVGSRYDLDLAVLKIEGDTRFPALSMGNSDETAPGDWLIAIGNPYDLDYTVTTGILSAKERSFTIEDEQGTRNYEHLFQTDTAINPGNSGGPLLNMKGEVIGINTAVSADAQGIGFAIPVSTVKSVLSEMMKGTGETI
ncbi:S1C family serine protease [Paenibacillus tarimensis]|uniref:S1C family serine protease n=1 Tax=Paenibacillus tarimensis TaxID=416012 RepID=UPI001F2D41EA|nr:trypsin-like peptidase domain-containing protein [Paenibacillus tarimensis]MCF2944614.1 trypsin-like peptidase domain-containing protein [Paenibacillus tarimensis]